MSRFRIGSKVQVARDHFYLGLNKGTVGKIVARSLASGGVSVELLIPRVITFQEHELKPVKRRKCK